MASYGSLTILSCAHAQLTKNLITGSTYDATSRVTSVEGAPIRGLKSLVAALGELAVRDDACVIRGTLRDDAPTPLRRRKTCFADEPQGWLMVDIDALRLPKALRTSGYTDEHAAFARSTLPDAFQGVSCVWQASASAGEDRRTLKMHLWFLLDQPVTCAALRAWLGRTPGLDPSVFRSVQPHYTAAPIGGSYCGQRIGLLRGMKAVRVPVALLATVEPQPAEQAPRRAGALDIALADIDAARTRALARAGELLRTANVGYQDAYAIGAILGVSVAQETWNDVAEGHLTWEALGRAQAAEWGGRVAELEGASHTAELYAGRVFSGIEWAVAQERERLGSRVSVQELHYEQALASEAKRLARSPTPRQLAASAKVLARWLAVVGRERIDADLRAASQQSPASVLAAIDAAASSGEQVGNEEWRDRLEYNRQGRALPTAENCLIIVDAYPKLMSSLRVNVRGYRIEAAEAFEPLWDAGPLDLSKLATRLVLWFGSLGVRGVSMSVAQAAIERITQRATEYDPLLQIEPHEDDAALSGWLTKYFGAEESDYVQAVARKSLVALFARAYHPGARCDSMVVLQGDQGVGKTNFLRVLGSAIFDGGYIDLPSVHSKDDVLAMHGACIVELSELAAFKRSENEALKALLTRCVDTVRKPYGRVAEELPRRVVFVGTTNDDEFLTDNANRRYWPVECHARKAALRFDAAQAWQLLAAAHAAYLRGETWYLDTEELVAAQRAAATTVRSVSILEEQLAPLLAGKDRVTAAEVFALANPDPRASVQHTAAARSRALRGLGFTPSRTSAERFWVRKSEG